MRQRLAGAQPSASALRRQSSVLLRAAGRSVNEREISNAVSPCSQFQQTQQNALTWHKGTPRSVDTRECEAG